MSKPRIILTRRWPEEVEEHLKTSYDVTINKDDVPMSKEQLQEALRNYDAFCPTVTDPVDAEVLGISDIKAKIIGQIDSFPPSLIFLIGIQYVPQKKLDIIITKLGNLDKVCIFRLFRVFLTTFPYIF